MEDAEGKSSEDMHSHEEPKEEKTMEERVAD